MKTLYFDCFAGASGNMILGALFELGVDRDEMVRLLRGLNIADFEIKAETVDRSGISATHVEVVIPKEHNHRHLRDILAIIDNSSLSVTVKARSSQIFTRLAVAEAKVHGIDVEKVHFHEVGALDAIVDVVGCCIGFELLGIEHFASSKIHVGSGFVEMAHGRFPVPPPAVAELLRGIPIYSTEISGELITPTGAAVISTVCSSYGSLPEVKVEKVAYGAGSRSYKDFPNVVRLMLCESTEEPNHNESLTLLETNLDDISPQVLGFVIEQAFTKNALDCWFTPIQMKKNRPAVMISILCRNEDKETLSDLLYSETTTLGLRVRRVDRECLSREIVKVSTSFGDLNVKIARRDGFVVNAMPEYEDVRQLAIEHNVPFRVVSDAALSALKNLDNVHAARRTQ
jgi:uncharacterized protein (TIGR00299 family) protein